MDDLMAQLERFAAQLGGTVRRKPQQAIVIGAAAVCGLLVFVTFAVTVIGSSSEANELNALRSRLAKCGVAQQFDIAGIHEVSQEGDTTTFALPFPTSASPDDVLYATVSPSNEGWVIDCDAPLDACGGSDKDFQYMQSNQ